MPTSSKLVAAILMAITGYLTAKTVALTLPDEQPTGMLITVSTIIPMICGWKVIGRFAGKGYHLVVSSGLYMVAVSLFYTLLAFSISDMFKRAYGMNYDGVIDAIIGIFALMLEFGMLVVNPLSIFVMVTGGIICAYLAEWAQRKWG